MYEGSMAGAYRKNDSSSNGGKYKVTEVLKVQIPSNKKFDLKIEFMDNTNHKNASFLWALDGMLIDEDLLYAEDEEADRIY
jgi:hypothetical protein